MQLQTHHNRGRTAPNGDERRSKDGHDSETKVRKESEKSQESKIMSKENQVLLMSLAVR